MTNWSEKKEKLKNIFTTLKEKDSLLEDQKMEEVLSRLEKQLGKTREALLKLIKKI